MESENSDTLASFEFKYQSRRLFSDPSKRGWRVILNGFGALSAFISGWGDGSELLQPVLQTESLDRTWWENGAAEIRNLYDPPILSHMTIKQMEGGDELFKKSDILGKWGMLLCM